MVLDRILDRAPGLKTCVGTAEGGVDEEEVDVAEITCLKGLPDLGTSLVVAAVGEEFGGVEDICARYFRVLGEVVIDCFACLSLVVVHLSRVEADDSVPSVCLFNWKLWKTSDMGLMGYDQPSISKLLR